MSATRPLCSYFFWPIVFYLRHYLCAVSFLFLSSYITQIHRDRASLSLAPIHFPSQASVEPKGPAHKERAANRGAPMISPGQSELVSY